MEGFVKEIDSVEEADPASAYDTAPDAVATVKARTGQTGPHPDDETIATFRGIAYGLPVAVGLWIAIIGVSAYFVV